MKITTEYKVWLHINGKPFVGKSKYELLRSIHKTKSLKQSAQQRNLSYRSVINYVRVMEALSKKKIVKTYRGGAQGGGYVELTAYGEEVITLYEQACRSIEE